MRAVIQRVTSASVVIDKQKIADINQGLLVLLGIEAEDNDIDIEWLAAKIAKMRIFQDENGLMNKSILQIEGDILLVSQFTLYASTKKGNRPGFTKSARPEIAIPLYNKMIKQLSIAINKPIHTGEFGADMKISLINDGPVTITIDTRNKE